MNAYDDLGNMTQTCDFAWDQVKDFDGIADQVPKMAEAMAQELSMEQQRRIWSWAWQPPCNDLDGYLCRCIVLSWIFVPQLRSYSMTEMAGRCGKKKQSLGRQVASLKKEFPELKHLQHIRDN